MLVEPSQQLQEKDPYEVLRSIGLTSMESRDLLGRLEEEQRRRSSKTLTGPQYSSSKLRQVTIIFWLYSLIVWLYVIAMQLRYPDSPHWPLALWLPVRMDYLGEVAFLASFILGAIAITWPTQARDISPAKSVRIR